MSVHEFLSAHPDSFHPVTRQVISRGLAPTGVDVFKGLDQLAKLRRRAEEQWSLMDFLVLPTAGRAFTLQEAAADPIGTSARLGRYTNFVNLMDLTALALPAGFATGGVPFGISLIGPAWSDANLLALGAMFFPCHYAGLFGASHPQTEPTNSLATRTVPLESERPRQILICVVGAHLSGQPLNHQLTELNAYLACRTRTAPEYRLYALATTPPKPGLVRVAASATVAGNGIPARGIQIEVEVWSMSQHKAGEFLARVPAPMCLGNILLENGEWVKKRLLMRSRLCRREPKIYQVLEDGSNIWRPECFPMLAKSATYPIRTGGRSAILNRRHESAYGRR